MTSCILKGGIALAKIDQTSGSMVYNRLDMQVSQSSLEVCVM